MFILGLNETIDQLSMAYSVCWYGRVSRRENGDVLRRALHLEVEGQRRKGRPKSNWKKQVEEKKYEGWFEKGRCTLPIKVECQCK